MSRRLTTQEFIERAQKIHGDKYDYSAVVYKTIKTKVKLFCKKHKSSFFITPNVHLRQQGCPQCGKESKVSKMQLTKREFIDKARAKHGHKYDYSRVVYINSFTKVEIICPVHGSFWQRPTAHYTHNCKLCTKPFSSKDYPTRQAYRQAYEEANKERITAQKKAWYQANKERVLAQKKAERETNREKLNAQKQAWREANREKINARQKAWREANKERLKAQREAKKEEINAQQRARRKAKNEKLKAQHKTNKEEIKADEE